MGKKRQRNKTSTKRIKTHRNKEQKERPKKKLKESKKKSKTQHKKKQPKKTNIKQQQKGGKCTKAGEKNPETGRTCLADGNPTFKDFDGMPEFPPPFLKDTKDCTIL